MLRAPVRLVQITDLHILPEPGRIASGEDPDASLRAVLEAIGREHPRADLIAATGDLTEDASPKAYERVKAHLAAAPAPVYCLPGNHDSPECMKAHLVGDNIHMQRSVTCGSWQLVFLDTATPGEAFGSLSADEGDALRETLRARSAEHVLICMHHGPFPPCHTRECGLDDAEDLLDLLAEQGSVRGAIWGHIHEVVDRRYRGLRLLGSPSTCVHIFHRPCPPGFVPESFADLHEFDISRRAYRRLLLHDSGEIETEVEWLVARS